MLIALRNAKKELKERLKKLDDLLNKKLFASTVSGGVKYDDWLKSHQPFHWLAEYYDIINGNGGFDVIIGNPPYVEYKKVMSIYKLSSSLYKTLDCGNLHAFIAERSFIISATKGNIGLIVPLPSINTTRMISLQNIIKNPSNNSVWISCFDERPSGLFEGVDQRLIVEIISKYTQSGLYSTKINRWLSENRNLLFKGIKYTMHSREILNLTSSILKLSSDIELAMLLKFYTNNAISFYKSTNKASSNEMNYRSAGGRYWKIFLDKPFGTGNSSEKRVTFNDIDRYVIISSVSSDVFWWYYSSHFDMFNLGDYQIFGFRLSKLSNSIIERLKEIGKKYERSLENNAIIKNVQTGHGIVSQKQYYVRKSKPIIDEIDKVLAKHYGFTEEELDFIINYDIKYRMGDELNDNE